MALCSDEIQQALGWLIVDSVSTVSSEQLPTSAVYTMLSALTPSSVNVVWLRCRRLEDGGQSGPHGLAAFSRLRKRGTGGHCHSDSEDKGKQTLTL